MMSTEEDFNAIYQAALADDEERLRTLKQNLLTLDVEFGFDTPISCLAFEGKFGAVQLLLRLGADKDEAVQGAARGGHDTLVEQLLQKGASKSYALQGAAFGGQNTLVLKLLQERTDKDWAVYSAARGGHDTLVWELLKQGASKNYAVQGAARGGHDTLVEQLLQKGASKDEAVYNAAFSGHDTLVWELLKQRASKNYAVRGASEGQKNELKEYLQRGHADHFSQFPIKPLSPLNLKQRMAWKNKSLFCWFTVCHELEKRLSKDIYLTIAFFLTDGQLNSNQLSTLQAAMFYIIIEQIPVMQALEKHDSSTNFKKDQALVQTTKKEVLEATTRKELLKALQSVDSGDQKSPTVSSSIANFIGSTLFNKMISTQELRKAQYELIARRDRESDSASNEAMKR